MATTEATIVWTMILMIMGAGTFWWIKHKVTIWYQSLPKRRALASTARAEAKEETKRRILVRLHTHCPDRILTRILRWNPESGKRPDVRIAKRGLWTWERIRPDQHIVAIGMTGSGKSSSLRILGAWALRNPDWSLEAWDGKWGASVAPYKGKCSVLTDIESIEARLADLVDRELPARADHLWLTGRQPGHLAIIMDESRLLNMLSERGMANLVTTIQTGRELGIHLWFGIQDPKTTSIPSEVRDQFTAKLVHMLQTAEAAQVALKELASAGWEANKLMRSGQVLIWTPVKGQKPGRVCFAVYLKPEVLAAIKPAGPFRDPAFAPRVSLLKATDRAQAPIGIGRTVGRSDTRTTRQTEAVTALSMCGPLSPAALGRELDVDRRRAAEVLGQLAAKGDAIKNEDGTYELTEATS